MSNTIIRYLRLHCQHPTARPEPHKVESLEALLLGGAQAGR